MNRTKFFNDIKRFRTLLGEPFPEGCWGCLRTDVSTTSLALQTDFKSLKIPPIDLPERISLCDKCSCDYMNSFNVLLDGNKSGYIWTPKRLRKMRLEHTHSHHENTDDPNEFFTEKICERIEELKDNGVTGTQKELFDRAAYDIWEKYIKPEA
jgi:hypothetical protein